MGGRRGYILYEELDEKDQTLLQPMCDIEFTDSSKVCFHYKKKYLFILRSGAKCCNPFALSSHNPTLKLKGGPHCFQYPNFSFMFIGTAPSFHIPIAQLGY